MQEPSEYYGVEKPSKCLSFLRLLWKFFRCIVSHITLVSMVVAYCVLGAYAFQRLEADHEIEVKKSIAKVRANVTNRIWAYTEDLAVLEQDNWTSTIIVKLIEFEKELVKKMKKEGWDGNEDPKNLQWTFAGALFYSIIVITTIGYGHIAPKTQNGKVVTIFYAIIGIPLMLLCLSNIGDVMATSFRFLYWKICCYVCTRPPKPRRSRHVNMLARSQSLRQPGRYASSNRSSTAISPFRRSLRVSQRSADSVLHTFPQSVMRSSHSDTDCSRSRHSAFASGNTLNDSNLRMENSPIPSRYRSANAAGANNNEGGMSSGIRYTEDAVASPRTLPRPSPRLAAAATQSLDRKCLVAKNDAERTPVLFNRYALDEPAREHSLPPPIRIREATSATLKNGDYGESCDPRLNGGEVSSRPWSSAPRRCRSVEEAAAASADYNDRFNSLHLPTTRPTRVSSLAARRTRSSTRPQRREASSARIMSPMGFAVHRQVYVDDVELDFDYLASSTGDDHDTTIKPVPIWLCVFLVVSYIFGGAFLFAEWETWPFLDSAYFCFITLTTIGFGDLVPAHRLNAHQGIALCSLYLLFGIALLAMSFNLVQEEVINNVKNVAKRLGIIKEEYEEDDDDDEEEYQAEEYNDNYLMEREHQDRGRYSREYGRSAYSADGAPLGSSVAAPVYDRFNSYRSERPLYNQQHERSAFRFASR